MVRLAARPLAVQPWLLSPHLHSESAHQRGHTCPWWTPNRCQRFSPALHPLFSVDNSLFLHHPATLPALFPCPPLSFLHLFASFHSLFLSTSPSVSLLFCPSVPKSHITLPLPFCLSPSPSHPPFFSPSPISYRPPPPPPTTNPRGRPPVLRSSSSGSL